ncbi:hypothetical protein TH24_21290 [Thalassospira xiamenensis]|nr:hypothetical protein TH24_21290 [Thalassospira xiamenensis]
MLKTLRGHFSFIAVVDSLTLVAVDHTRSIPLFFAKTKSGWQVGDDANRLRKAAELDHRYINIDAHLSIAMSGTTLGARTLYDGLEVLLPGEFVLLENGRKPMRHFYSGFRPWLTSDSNEVDLKKEFKEKTLTIFERLFSDIKGRCLVIPLSAGYDSRLIAALAKHMGHKDVFCFTYGRAGNFEARTSADICERLGFNWTFVPSTISEMRRYFVSDLHHRYIEFSDDATSVPFVQDIFALNTLIDKDQLPADAVIVNGQSGDFISGNHIPVSMLQIDSELDESARKKRMLDAYVDKHFSLWKSLQTQEKLGRAHELIWAEIQSLPVQSDRCGIDHGLYEAIEFINRQSKYVVAGQRGYDFLGLDWRLPLWDADYLEFWAKVPRRWKIGQILYKETIKQENWGDVWQDLPINKKTVRPLSLALLRNLAKMACAPCGKNHWKIVEKKYFQYWMEVTCHTAVVPYRTWASDRRGARNAMSWLVEAFLSRHGLELEPYSINE